MQRLFQIGEVADLLQINTSKLRFWEQQGLLRLDRNGDNNYRQYSFLDLLHVSDIMFYRDLHFSMKELQHLFQLSAGELEQELEQKLEEVDDKIKELQQTRQKIQVRRNYLQEAIRLQEHPYQMGRPDFQQIRLVGENSKEDWRCSIVDQYASVVFQADAGEEMQYCLLTEDRTQACIWQLEPEQLYAEVLLYYAVEDNEHNNVQEHCRNLQCKGWQTGCIISRYLFTSNEHGVSYDYYKGWIAVYDNSAQK